MLIRNVAVAGLCAVAFAMTAGMPTAARASEAVPIADGLIVRLKTNTQQAALAWRVDTAEPRSEQRRRAAVALESSLRGRLATVLATVGNQNGQTLDGASIAQPVGRASHLLHWERPQDRAHLQSIAELLMQQADVESVELDTVEPRLAASTVTPTPSDPLYARQMWLQKASTASAGLPDIPAGWLRTTGSPTSGQPWIPVAVLDTGMLADHPDLAAKWLPGYDFITRPAFANDGDGRDADPSDPGDWVLESDTVAGGILAGCTAQDSSWHGTLIAGQIAASTNNNLGVAGVNWEARIVPVRVGGRCGAQLSDIIDAMRWSAGLTVLSTGGQAIPANPNPVRVINLSFGGTSACGSVMQDTIDELKAAGVVVVAAAGNASGAISRPANCNGVISVGALNALGFKAPYSNFGSQLVISTVGGDQEGTDACSTAVADAGILSTHNTGTQGPLAGGYDYTAVAGTSFSAPIVAGTVSLMLALNPTLTVDQIINGLKATARPHALAARLGECSSSNAGRCACTVGTCGAGILDTPRALAFAADPVNYVPPALVADVVDAGRLASCSTNGAVSPGGLTSLTPSSDASAAAAGDSGGGSVDAAWLLLSMAAIASMALTGRRARAADRKRRVER